MIRQVHIIAFCYLYIAGIIVAMLAPVDPAALLWLRIAVAVTLIPAGALMLAGLLAPRGAETDAPRYNPLARYFIPLLCVGALLLGYTRHISANTVPDMRVGEIRIEGGTRAFHQTAALPDTSRIRLRKTTALDRDLKVRITGELDARRVVKDARGVSSMDEQGRWQFTVVRAPLASEVITIPAADPVGTDYVVDQPFNRITGIEWIDGPDAGAVTVYRISNHIGSFVRPGRAQSSVTILARITSDPRVYDFKTVLMVTPEYIQFPAGGPFFKVEGGDIQVTVPPVVDDYERFAVTGAYGMDLELKGELTVARAESNPGGFNARQFMANYNIYGLMNLFQSRDAPSPIHAVGPGGGEPRAGHPLVSFSLDLRDRILRVFKATMPHPQSAFLGGVTLGLRYGLQGVQYPGPEEKGAWMQRVGLGRSEATIVDDFRASGVNHVLAVSGLHVTILTAMFIAIFSLLRLPKQFFVPLVMLALVVFAIITGARPSTLRAVIMNSLFLLTWAYLDRGLLSSVMIGVPVAAFMILLHNPLVVVDPSFTLSFGAILSLALITMPVHEILCNLRGNRFAVVILLSFATTLIGIKHWALLVAPAFLLPWLLVCVMLFLLAGALEQRGLAISRKFAFSALPEPVSTFLAAQVAIQIGMMIPLSAYYFTRWPFGGAYANLIAIPLIGVVVQLGAIAGILGLIPVVGPYIALLLSAANYTFTTFFLWLAHVTTNLFPYPVVRRPRVIEVVVYYFFIAAFIWHKPLWKWVKGVCDARGWKHRAAPGLVLVALAAVAASPLVIAPPRDTRPPGLHVTVLSVGYGSSILIETPGGRNILVDTGFVEYERGRRNEADRTILPFLSTMGIRSLDVLILTSPLPERAAGASYLLDQLRVDHLIVPPSLAALSPAMRFEEFEQEISGGAYVPETMVLRMYEDLVVNPVWPQRFSLARELSGRGDTFVNRWGRWHVNVQAASAGMALFEENVDGKRFRIEVLGPGEARPSEFPVENSGLVLRVVYGDFAMLLPGSLHYEGQGALARAWPAEQLRAAVMTVPHHGAANPTGRDRPPRATVDSALTASAGSLLDKVQPERVIFEFGSPRPVLGDLGRAAVGVRDITTQFYTDRLGADALLSTERDLAITIHSDGRTFTIETLAQRHRAEGGEEGAVSDLQVGF